MAYWAAFFFAVAVASAWLGFGILPTWVAILAKVVFLVSLFLAIVLLLTSLTLIKRPRV